MVFGEERVVETLRPAWSRLTLLQKLPNTNIYISELLSKGREGNEFIAFDCSELFPETLFRLTKSLHIILFHTYFV